MAQWIHRSNVSPIPHGFMSFNWLSIILFARKNTHWRTLRYLLLEMICIVFKAMQDFTPLATLESMRTLGTTGNKIVHKIQTLGGFATGFICRCKMIFNTDFMHSSRHILLSGRHLFKQGALMNSLWVCDGVFHPTLAFVYASPPIRVVVGPHELAHNGADEPPR